VVYQQNGERNFHSFYSLIHGASETELKRLKLSKSEKKSYFYINQGNSFGDIDSDSKNYKAVNESLKMSKFNEETITTIWNLIAAIIHLGDLKFNEINDRAQLNDTICAKKIEIISKLLKIESKEITEALTSRLIATGSKDLLTTFFTVNEAIYARDALSKVKFQ
jgi:myosin I